MYRSSMLRKATRIAFAGLLLVGLAGCGNDPVKPAETLPEGAIAAIVNGGKIYASDVELEAVAQGVISPGDEFGPKHSDYDTVLDQVIDQRLMAQEAERLGLAEDPMAARRLATARERILANLLIENIVADEITDARIDEMYTEQVALQQLDDEVSIAHILLDTEAEAKAVHQKILEGAAFDSLVFSHSKDAQTRMTDGDLGFVAPNEQPEPFGTIIANTKIGEVSEPFQSASGWHILTVRERRTLPPKTKAEMRPEIVTFLTLTEISNILQRLRAEASFQQGEAGAHEDIGLNPLQDTPPADPPKPEDSL